MTTGRIRSYRSAGLLIGAMALMPVAGLAAEPIIRAVNGAFGSGNVLVIKGSGFGNAGAAAPLIWNRFETPPAEDRAAEMFGLRSTRSQSRHAESGASAHTNFSATALEARARVTAGDARRWFTQYWFLIEENWDWGSAPESASPRFLSRVVAFRMWDPQNYDERFDVVFNGVDDRIEAVVRAGGSERSWALLSGLRANLEKGRWHLLQIAYADSSAPARADGAFSVWLDGRLLEQAADIVMRVNGLGYKRPSIVGFSAAWGPNIDQGEEVKGLNDFYMDDLYVEEGWARVEIGDRPRYDACTRREVQIPARWSDGSITFSAGSALWPAGTPVFLFVTNEEGETNRNGHALAVGNARWIGAPPAAGAPAPDLSPGVEILRAGDGEAAFGDGAFSATVFDPAGVPIRRLVRTGRDPLVWRGQDERGRNVPPEIYLIKVEGLWGDVTFRSIKVER